MMMNHLTSYPSDVNLFLIFTHTATRYTHHVALLSPTGKFPILYMLHLPFTFLVVLLTTALLEVVNYSFCCPDTCNLLFP